MLDLDRIHSFIQQEGIVLPTRIAKEFRIPLLYASAVLSQFSSEKKVIVSSVKVGGSPLYYVESKKHLLTNYLKNLNEKDQRAAALLQEKKILRDTDHDPLTRVSLRNIKDFSIPLTVHYDGKEEQFWKWYLVSEEEARGIIRTILDPASAISPPDTTTAAASENPPVDLHAPTPSAPLHAATHATIPSAALPSIPEHAHLQPLPQQPEKKKRTPRKPSQSKQPAHTTQETLSTSTPETKPLQDDAWAARIIAYLTQKNAQTHTLTINKREADASFVANIPSPFGNTSYYVRALHKKRLSEADILESILEANDKKRPLMLITDATLTKKLEEQVSSKYPGLLLVRL